MMLMMKYTIYNASNLNEIQAVQLIHGKIVLRIKPPRWKSKRLIS